MQNQNHEIITGAIRVSQASLGYRRFQIGCVIAECDLFKQNFVYTDFCTNLTQFYINFSRQGQQKELSLVSINSFDT